MTQGNTGRKRDGKTQQLTISSEVENQIFDNRMVSSNWLTTNEAATYLRTSPNQVRNWVYQGKVRAYKLMGKSLRFRSHELDLLHRGGR